MIPLLLLAAAFGVIAVALILVVWRYADRRVRLADSDQAVVLLQEQLARALAAQQNLTARVENLEAIVASEAWEALRDEQGSPPLAAPEAPAEPSNDEKVARVAGRQRGR